MHILPAVFAAAVVMQAAQTAQPPPTTQPPPPQPTTTAVGADGKLVSLIFLRADAENVTRRVYDALLDRPPNEQEFAESVAELQRGRLPQQLSAIVQNAEFASRVASLSASQVLDQIFDGMLNRGPTPAETKTYLPQIQARQYPPALLKLITSDSFRKQVAQDRAAAGTLASGAPASPTSRSTAAERPPSTPTSGAGRPGSATPPSMPPPTPATSGPPATTVPMPATAAPAAPPSLPGARPPLRPAPFPTARSAAVSTPLVAAPALSPEWARVLECQDKVVGHFRTDPASSIVIRFDAAEISTSSVRGSGVDVIDGNRRLTYLCTGGRVTAGHVDSRARRAAQPGADFPLEEIRACHAAVADAVRQTRRDAALSFETAGLMPTDGHLFIRGRGADRTQPFSYQCQWDGANVLGPTFTFVSR